MEPIVGVTDLEPGAAFDSTDVPQATGAEDELLFAQYAEELVANMLFIDIVFDAVMEE